MCYSYIKEFVHGDFGRTKPNMCELLKTDTDILELDVEVTIQLDLQWKSVLEMSLNCLSCLSVSRWMWTGRRPSQSDCHPHQKKKDFIFLSFVLISCFADRTDVHSVLQKAKPQF